MISPVLFYCMAFIVIFGALLMVSSNNLVHSAVYMVFTFFGVAGIYATLQLSFFAVLQILIYVGAITILVIFGIMLTRMPGEEMITADNPFTKRLLGAGSVSVAVAAVMSIVIRTLGLIQPGALPDDYIQEIGIRLFGVYILPVELIGVLLLVAMLGAVMIAKEADER